MNSGYFYAPYVPLEEANMPLEDMQTTLAMLKPDCVRQHLVGTVINRLEQLFQIVAIKTVRLYQRDVDFLYGKYQDEDFYGDLSDFMKSECCHLLYLRGSNAVNRLRAVIGADKPVLGTIRGDYGNKKVRRENVIHASDSLEAAKRELDYFFPVEELELLEPNESNTS